MTAKKTSARAKKPVKKPAKKAAAKKAAPSRLPSHAAALNELHPELRTLINDFLQKNKIPLQLHSIRLADAAPGGFNCCLIGGMVHCGPDCP
jgi:hypothetical protein